MEVLVFANSKDPAKDRFFHEISKAPRLSPKFVLEHAILYLKIQVFLRLKSVEDQLLDLNNTLNEQVRVHTEQLIDAEKMANIGRYAAGIAHNLNNLLNVIIGYAELFAMQHPEDRTIMSLNKAAEQMKETIATILNTGHMQSKEKKIDIDLNQVITDQVELLKSNSFF